MKKIIIVGEYMLCGGVEKSLISLLKYIDSEKYTITLMLLKKKGVLLPEIPKHVKVIEIPLPTDEKIDILYGKGNALKIYLKELKLITFIKKLLRAIYLEFNSKSDEEKRVNYYKMIDKKFSMYEGEYDIAIDYMGYGLLNTFYVAKKIKAKKKLTWVHFEPEQAMKDFQAFQYFLNDFDRIVCVSQEIYRQMKEKLYVFNDRLKVFYNIIDIDYIYSQADKNTLIDDQYDGDKILSVGRLDKQKGFDIVIPVIKKLIDENYKIKWFIIGEGNLRKELEFSIKKYGLDNHIFLLGQKTNPYPYIAKCDIYFQPSRHEGYGIAVAEARAFNKPIIVTDFAGAKEQIKNYETGLIVKCNDDALYKGLKLLLDNPKIKIRFSNNLMKEAQHLEIIKEQVIELLED